MEKRTKAIAYVVGGAAIYALNTISEGLRDHTLRGLGVKQPLLESLGSVAKASGVLVAYSGLTELGLTENASAWSVLGGAALLEWIRYSQMTSAPRLTPMAAAAAKGQFTGWEQPWERREWERRHQWERREEPWRQW
jgi:hypothetical protein